MKTYNIYCNNCTTDPQTEHLIQINDTQCQCPNCGNIQPIPTQEELDEFQAFIEQLDNGGHPIQ